MRQRQGFTLVEMLVAMALTLFIMVILSQAFIASLDTFRGLKAIGDMDEGLRTTANVLRSDLLMDHLLDATDKPIPLRSFAAPTSGFFRIFQGAAGTVENNDWESISSYPNGTMVSRLEPNHILHFSVYSKQIYQPGGSLVTCRPENFFIASVKAGSPLLSNQIDTVYPTGNDTPYRSGNTISGQWAEVAYFLVKQGTTAEPNNPSGAVGAGVTPLYKLYRTQFLVLQQATNVKSLVLAADQGSYNNLSFIIDPVDNTKLQFNEPKDLATGTRRFNPAAPNTTGATLLLNNVVSFAVQALAGGSDFADLNYDTNGATSSVSALQVSIRVWDVKTQSTRQITIIQDM